MVYADDRIRLIDHNSTSEYLFSYFYVIIFFI